MVWPVRGAGRQQDREHERKLRHEPHCFLPEVASFGIPELVLSDPHLQPHHGSLSPIFKAIDILEHAP
jgi:hypothetical protein